MSKGVVENVSRKGAAPWVYKHPQRTDVGENLQFLVVQQVFLDMADYLMQDISRLFPGRTSWS